jgi:hypothetical protein
VYKRIAFLFAITLPPWTGHAGFYDPTRPAYPETPPPTTATAPDAEPKLSAIWFLPGSRWATINGIQAREGQTLTGNIKIIMIRRNSVKINQNGVIKTLVLIKRPLNNR